MSDIDDLVTVVIPARNEAKFIAACLRSVQEQGYDNLQIIVVDGASEDCTRDIVVQLGTEDARIELLLNPQQVIPVGLNLAVSAARGVWLVRIDAHATVPPDYVRRAVAHLRSGAWAGVGGRKDGHGVTPAGRAIAVAMASRFGVGNSTYHHGVSVESVEHIPFGAYPIRLVRELGGWNEELVVNQDFEFDYRVRRSGHQLLFDPELVIKWHCRQTVKDLYRQYRRYGRGKVAVARLHPRSLRWRHLIAPALVAWCAGAALVACRRPFVAAAMVGPYIGAASAASVRSARRLDDPMARIWVAPAFVAMHVGWGVGFWQGVWRELVSPAARRRAEPGNEHLRTAEQRWWGPSLFPNWFLPVPSQ